MKTVILCYHKIGPETEEGRFLNCSPERLDNHARFFRRKNWNGFLPRHFQAQRPKGICFTFDDSYESAVTSAPAILEKYQYRGAFYVVPSLVGKTSSWDLDKARPLANWDQIISLAGRGHEIGNHSNTHPRLAELDLDSQIEEIRLASEEMRNRGLEPDSLVFPYGSFNDDTLKAMKELDIPVGLALGKRPVTIEPANCLPRIVVGFSDTVTKLLYKIYVRPKLP